MSRPPFWHHHQNGRCRRMWKRLLSTGRQMLDVPFKHLFKRGKTRQCVAACPKIHGRWGTQASEAKDHASQLMTPVGYKWSVQTLVCCCQQEEPKRHRQRFQAGIPCPLCCEQIILARLFICIDHPGTCAFVHVRADKINLPEGFV